MTAIAQTVLFMLAVLAAVAVAAKRLNIAPSILLVVAGIGMALIPGLPKVQLAPELVLLVILPPLIYSAGVAMSWREFRFNLRPIALLAFGCVVFTTCAVAAAAHYLLGFDWAVGFLLGAIIAPPDVVAPLAIARRLGLPRRLVVVLEGEGLANDATALILYRFAVVAVSTGAFSLGEAAGTFALIVVGEIVYGIGVGWLSLRLRQWAREPRVEITLSLMTPYLAYWVPEHLGGSGVLATVACGLYVSWNGPRLIPSATRLQGIFFWDLIVYLIEGLVFLLTGLQARALIDEPHVFSIRDLLIAMALDDADRDRGALHLGVSGHLHSALAQPVVAQARSVAALARAVLARRSPACAAWCRSPPRLAIPYTLANGAPFPHRELIQYRDLRRHHLHAGRPGPDAADGGALARLSAIAARKSARTRSSASCARARPRFEAGQQTAGESSSRIAACRTKRSRICARAIKAALQILPVNLTEGLDHMRQTARIKAALIEAERDFIYQLLRDGKITDEARRRIEYELDLEEASVANRGERRRRVDVKGVHARILGRVDQCPRLPARGCERREHRRTRRGAWASSSR